MLVSFLICGCSAEKKNPDKNNVNMASNSEIDIGDPNSVREVYSGGDCVAFLANGNDLYISTENSDEIIKYKDGNEETRYSLGEGGMHTNLCISDNFLYSVSYTDKGLFLNSFNTANNETKSFELDHSITSVLSMCAVGEYVYAITWDLDNYRKYDVEKFDENDDYCNYGELIYKINTSDGSAEKMDIPNIVCLAEKANGIVVFYAYDSEGGYYFTEYDCEKNKFSEKKYNNNFKYIFSFAADGDTILFSDLNNAKVSSSGISDGIARSDIAPNIWAKSGNDVQFSGGYCYALDSMTGNVFMAPAVSAQKNKAPIRACISELFNGELPTCGHTLKNEHVSDEEFCLKILANDSDYDLCMMQTGQPFSIELRNKGAFYPLNDVPYVKEYTDALFPGLKKIAVNENGDIWMLPVSAEVVSILYDDEMCSKYGIDIKSMTCEDIYKAGKKLYSDESLRESFAIRHLVCANCMIEQYESLMLSKGNEINYDSDTFRDICRILTEYSNSDFLQANLKNTSDRYDSFIFSVEAYNMDIFSDKVSNFNVAGFPLICEGAKQTGDCQYICVNANSDNLEGTLEYISSYCKYMLESKNTFIFSDKSRYTDIDKPVISGLYEVYSNADFTYRFPREVFEEDYIRFLNEEISADDFIKEINRKVNMYLNE